jgi:hypothetical protein
LEEIKLMNGIQQITEIELKISLMLKIKPKIIMKD